MRIRLRAHSAAVFLAIAVLALAAMAGRAEVTYPWCAVASSGGLGQPLCHFATLEQCMVFLNGLTGSCRQNPRAAAAEPASKRGSR